VIDLNRVRSRCNSVDWDAQSRADGLDSNGVFVFPLDPPAHGASQAATGTVGSIAIGGLKEIQDDEDDEDDEGLPSVQAIALRRAMGRSQSPASRAMHESGADQERNREQATDGVPVGHS